MVSLALPSLARAQVTLPFKDVLFVERGIRSYPNPYDTGGTHNEADGFHFCDEYFGHNGRTGGGLFILKDFQGAKQKVDIVAGLKVPTGMVNAGQTLSSGTFLSPDLSFDGNTVVFAWSSGGSEKWQAKNRFHIFKVDIDGQNLVQLTDGNFDDFQPAWMPNGRIIFVSTRRGGYGRCHGRPVPTYTLYSMKSDGSDIIRLSYHETNEFHPQIANDGRIIFTRWDYIDRDFNAAHHLWLCNPDGSNPRAWGGNYCGPMDTLGSGPWTDGRYQERPFAEYYGRPIPGSMTKFVATAGPHHGEAYGTLIIRDYSKVDDNQMSQVTKLTPEVAFPEANRGGTLTYGPAYPLSETLFLTSYDNKMVLLDTSVKPAKRTEIYATKDLSTRPIYAQPVMARTPPPIITETTYQGERWSPSVPPATVQIANVYTTDSYGKLPADVKIKSLRVVQVLPKTNQIANDPRVGHSSQNVAKMALGTVPVEEDGSVFFEAPIEREILFQVLDERGMAVQTMRSGTFLHPGENMTCVGCHEDKWNTPPPSGTPMASKRPASKLEPELGKIEPINYARTIKPILAKCYACHAGKTGSPPTDTSYGATEKYSFYFMSDGSNTVAGHGGSRSKPGQIGARGSRMGKALMSNTHKQALTDGKFAETDVRTIAQWLDLGSDELGAFDNAASQRQGNLVWPTLDVDKNDPQGFKYSCEGRPCPTGTGGTGGTRASSQGAGGTGGGTPAGGQTGGAGAGGTKATSNSSSGGAVAGGSTSPAASSASGGASAGGSKASTNSPLGGASGEGSKGSAAGGQSGSGNASAGKGGSEASSAGAPGSASNGASNPSPASAQASSGGCSMGTGTRASARPLLLLVIGLAGLVLNRRKR